MKDVFAWCVLEEACPVNFEGEFSPPSDCWPAVSSNIRKVSRRDRAAIWYLFLEKRGLFKDVYDYIGNYKDLRAVQRCEPSLEEIEEAISYFLEHHDLDVFQRSQSDNWTRLRKLRFVRSIA